MPALPERRFHALRRERNLAKARARGIEHSVADGGGDHRDGGLARAGRFFIRPVQQHAFHFRNAEAERQGVIGSPVNRRHLLVVPGDFFQQRAAHALERAAFGLILQAVRIGDRAGVDGDDHALYRDLSGVLIHFDLGDDAGVSVVAFIGDASDAAAGGEARSCAFRIAARDARPNSPLSPRL